MSKLLLIEQYFFPEGWGGAEIPRDIAIGLRKAGFDVDVLCSKDQYAPLARDDHGEDPTSCGIRIFRIPRIVPGSVHRFKVIRIIWFCLAALPRLLVHSNVSLYVTQTNPLLVVPTVAVAAAIRRKPFMIIAQDLYPEALFAARSSAARSLLGRCLQLLFSWSYRRARRIVALGPYMRRRIVAKGVDPLRVTTISNWATGRIQSPDVGENPLRTQWDLENRFVVLYSGNMGTGHEFDTLLYGLQSAALGARVALAFIGSGVRLPEIRALVVALDLAQCVTFKDYVPGEVLPLTLGLANLAVVTLRAGFEGVIVPSKLLGYMARGIPVLYIGPESDAAEMIREADCGMCCANGDVAAVAEVLRRATENPELLIRWGENARRAYRTQFARELALPSYVSVVRAAIASASS